jgi:hypothetical protein
VSPFFSKGGSNCNIASPAYEEGMPLFPNVYFLLHRSPAADSRVVDSLVEHIAKAFGAIGQT